MVVVPVVRWDLHRYDSLVEVMVDLQLCIHSLHFETFWTFVRSESHIATRPSIIKFPWLNCSQGLLTQCLDLDNSLTIILTRYKVSD